MRATVVAAAYRAGGVTVLLLTHERYLDHDLGRGHPERPDRLRAVLDGHRGGRPRRRRSSGPCPGRPRGPSWSACTTPASSPLIAAVGAEGGGWLDADTAMNDASYDAALLAAGAGPDGDRAPRRRRRRQRVLRRAARPATTPRRRGRWASASSTTSRSPPPRWPTGASGCSIVDYDAHHGNGTQDIFWSDDRVAYVSFHQYPLYPGTGGLREVGAGAGRGTTINLPLPAGATGDVYRAGVDEVLAPVRGGLRADLAAHLGRLRRPPRRPAHRPRALGRRLRRPHRRAARAGAARPAVVFLEGGYDLEALAASSAAVRGRPARASACVPEPPTGGGPGREAVAAAALGAGRARRLRLKFGARRADVGQMTQLEELLTYLHEVRGSDLHLKPGIVAPRPRRRPAAAGTRSRSPRPGMVEALAAGVLDAARQDELATTGEADFGLSVPASAASG